jgi:NADH:ubiquinone reductase (H+-translocating)
VDWPGRRVLLEDGSAAAFAYLVLAPGVVPAFAGVPGAAAHAIPLKLVTDATQLRNRLLRSFETAAARPGSAAPGATSIAVVGGGPTGVELSGYIANFLFHYQFEADYPQLDPAAMRVTLLERGDRLLPGFHPALSAYALKMLRSRGVDVRLGTDVIEVGGDGSPSAAASGSRLRPWCGRAASTRRRGSRPSGWPSGTAESSPAPTCVCPVILTRSRSAT